MPAGPVILPNENAPIVHSENRTGKTCYRRTGLRAAGEVLCTLPCHPLSVPVRAIAHDLNLSHYATERALDGIAAGGVGVVRADGCASISPGSWRAAQERGEEYWHATYEHPTAA
jgi:hypothetical protein